MARQPVVAGKFYNENFQKLEEEIKESFFSKLGPGDLSTKRTNQKIKAVIVPHAGYIYSGSAAAWGYKELGESEFPDTYVILGPNHYTDKSAISIEDWKTPMGFVKNDKELSKKICEGTGLVIDESSHNNEHSIEVQLPFLQFVSKDNLDKLKIVPITIGSDIKITEFAKKLRKSIEESKKNVVFIISSDFTHYGRSYGYIPFEENPQEKIKKMDLKTIDFIKKNDVQGLVGHLEDTQSTICGKIPIIILMQTLGNYKAGLEIYYTSSEISRDEKNSVSYVAITFK